MNRTYKYIENRMSAGDEKNRMMKDLKNRMNVVHQKNKMSVVEGDNIINFEKPNQNQNHPHHSKSKSKTEIGFCNGISFGILSATRDSAILSVLFNIIVIISKQK